MGTESGFALAGGSEGAGDVSHRHSIPQEVSGTHLGQSQQQSRGSGLDSGPAGLMLGFAKTELCTQPVPHAPALPALPILSQGACWLCLAVSTSSPWVHPD